MEKAGQEEEYRRAIKTSIQWMISNNFLQEAKKMIADYEKTEQEDINIYFMKGVIAIKEKDYEKAIEELLEGCALDNNNFDMLCNLGYIYEQLSDLGLARMYYKKALRSTQDRENQESVYQVLKAMGETAKLEDILNKKIKTIYIPCSNSVVTGGTELLHQLCCKLNKIGYEAYMCYGDIKKPVPDRFKIYHNRYTRYMLYQEDSIVIVPEVGVPWALQYLTETKFVIWWLSVDNFVAHLKSNLQEEKQILNTIRQREKGNRIVHFVQSQYAREYLSQNGIEAHEIYDLSDYLNKEFMKEMQNSGNKSPRYANVLYNPLKGYEFTSLLIQAAPELNWIPLQNYTPEEMRNIMSQSMVYIDFGNHPGKDRMPREAAICGCCIIVGQRGAAYNPVDIPIPAEYKIEDKIENLNFIIGKIKEVLQNYEVISERFNDYRDIICGEEERFESDVRAVFSEIIGIPQEEGSI